MKKLLMVVCTLAMIIGLSGCTTKTYEIEIVIPAGNTDEIVYAKEELKPIRNNIIVKVGTGFSDGALYLKPVALTDNSRLEGKYITKGVNAKLEVSKDESYHLGLSLINESDEDLVVSVFVTNIEIK